MQDYVIVTDSAADLTEEEVRELGVRVIPLQFTIGTETYRDYPDRREMDLGKFYDRLRAEEVATTAAINVSECRETFEAILKEGKDVLGLAFSSGLSSSYQAYELAAQELREEYPERKILVVDTLCASRGQGLLVYHAAKRQGAGATVEECRDFVEENKLHLCHWFTVSDLHFLKRGGRVSAATAVVGTMLSIKPIMHVDNEGHLIKVSTARGRKSSIRDLVDRTMAGGIDPTGQTMFICHGDCLEDAQYMVELLKERGVTDVRVGYTGPVIGAHSGPGTLALFSLGEHR